MNKKGIVLVGTILLIFVIIAIVFCIDNITKEKTNPDISVEEQMEGSSGLEDSIFDDEVVPSEQEKESEDEKTDSVNTDKENNKGKNNKKNNKKNKEDKEGKEENTEAEKPTAAPTEKAEVDLGQAELDYSSFHELSPSKQQEYMNSFEDIDAFFKWYNAEKEKYEKENPPIEIDGGAIDLSEIAGENQ